MSSSPPNASFRKKKRSGLCWVLATAIFALVACGSAAARPASGADYACSVIETNFAGWKAVQMSNTWVKLTIVPQIGGRVMQIEFAGHPFLFVNPEYKGKHIPPPPDAAAKGTWFNYGGDKIWPMPEGNEDEHHWPGPIADALDDGEYSATVLSQGHLCRVRLDGPPDEKTGLQYSREITLEGISPEISFHAVMKNITTHPIEWSMQSVTQYDLADSQNPAAYNHNFWAYTPANPDSAYLDRFHVRSGLADDPSFSVQNDLFTLHWLYLQNEVWVDSPGDWLTVVDRASHFAMVESFTVHAGANYPGKATVIFYKNGPAVEMDAQGMLVIRTNAEDAPFYMEAEINSPIVRLDPGETYAMDTEWFPTRAADAFHTVNPAGLVAEPLSAVGAEGKIRLTGSFGVFFPGKIEARALDSAGEQIDVADLGTARPEDLLTLNLDIPAPAGASRVEIHLIDDSGKDRGLLGAATVSRRAGSK